jgi:hypothetical protein
MIEGISEDKVRFETDPNDPIFSTELKNNIFV